MGKEIGKLGFGMMRLPRNENGIDIEETNRMVDAFLSSGLNYFDTAFAYPGSEEAVREALVDRYPRESFFLATKCAIWSGCKSREDAISELETSLSRSGAGYFDYYLLHALNARTAPKFEEWGLWDYFLKKKEEGKIRHLGFSFHDTPETLDEILTRHKEAEFVQLQINWADWDNPQVQSRRCWEVARKHNKEIIVMEPVKGGLLASPHAEVVKAFSSSASPSSWAIRFAASLDGVKVVLSGMSNMEQMEDNLSTMKDFKPLSDEEKKTVERAREIFSSLPSVPCTKCDYCAKVCPAGIGISGTFASLNTVLQFNNKERARERFAALVTSKDLKGPEECLKCGKCEEACPQHIEIRKNLEKASEVLK